MTHKITRYFTLIAFLTMPLTAISQEDSVESNNIEEITVTGSQIKGAKITGALPVSVLDFQDVEALGVDSGDELLENVVENGMNFFNEAEMLRVELTHLVVMSGLITLEIWVLVIHLLS